MNCRNCSKPLKRNATKFCSIGCYGKAKRGTGESHIRIRIGGERKYLHRHLVETLIRPLKAGEIVHHKDENRHNNELSNLEILSDRAAHLHAHDYFRGKRKFSPAEESQAIADINEFGF